MAEQDNDSTQNQSSEGNQPERPSSPPPEPERTEPSEQSEPRRSIQFQEPERPAESSDVRPSEPSASSEAEQGSSSQSQEGQSQGNQNQGGQRRDQRQGQYRNQRGGRNNYRNRSDNRNRPERQEQRPPRVVEEGDDEERSDSQPQERSERTDRPDRPESQHQARQRHQFEGRERDRAQERDRDRGRGAGRPQERGGDRGYERGQDRSSLFGSNVSVVIPLLNEEQSLRELYEQLKNTLQKSAQYEIIFVDDGSTDGSFRVLMDLRNRDKRVKIIRFRRNYGKSAALSVGFQHAKGDYIITMDADLQDDPAEIPNLINEVKKGFDLVSGWKKKRHDPITKTIPSKFFNFVTAVMTGVKLHDMNCGLKAYRKEVVRDINLYGELHRYIPVLANWEGFKIGEAAVQHRARKFGKTKFGIGRFWKGFLDLLTVLFTTRYLQRPLHLFGFWGLGFFTAGFAVDLYLSILKFTEGLSLSNRPLFLGGILLIIVGIQFVSVGLIGELIVKTRSKDREEYSIREIWK